MALPPFSSCSFSENAVCRPMRAVPYVAWRSIAESTLTCWRSTRGEHIESSRVTTKRAVWHEGRHAEYVGSHPAYRPLTPSLARISFATEIPVAGGGTTCSRTFVTSIGWMQKLAKHAAVPPVAYGRSIFAVLCSDIAARPHQPPQHPPRATPATASLGLLPPRRTGGAAPAQLQLHRERARDAPPRIRAHHHGLTVSRSHSVTHGRRVTG